MRRGQRPPGIRVLLGPTSPLRIVVPSDRPSKHGGVAVLELQLPGLADEPLSEAPMALLGDELEAGLFVDVAGGPEHPGGADGEPPVSGRTAGSDAPLHHVVSRPDAPGPP